MDGTILARFAHLFTQPSLGHLATVNPDGSPQVTPVWVDREGELILVNTEESTVKVRNMRGEPRVALTVLDPANPNCYVGIQGRVVALRRQGAGAHLARLERRYHGEAQTSDGDAAEADDGPHLVVMIRPERVHAFG